MIPKVIHYCWFGGPETDLVRACVESWRQNLDGYQIIKWDETNFDVSQNEFCSRWYKAKLYAFVADYARIKILYAQGGIYLDSDIRILPGRCFDQLLDAEAFVGFQFPWPNVNGPDPLEQNRISNGVIGSVPGSQLLLDMLSQFEHPADPRILDARFSDFRLPVDHTKKVLQSYGLQSYGR